MSVDGDVQPPQIDLPPAWRIAVLATTVALCTLATLAFRLWDRRDRARAAVAANEATALALLRKRPPETTAGAGAHLTLLPPVEPHEDVR